MSESLQRISRWAQTLHPRICAAARAAPQKTQSSHLVNAKGDIQEAFDINVQQVVLEAIQEEFGGGIVLSEEHAGLIRLGNDPSYRFVIDPIDGSTNFKRGLPLSATCVAALPLDGPISVETVDWAVAFGLTNGISYVAQRGAGAWLDSRRLRTRCVPIEHSILSIELDRYSPTTAICDLMATVGGIRSYCCTAMSLLMIAEGILDAHIDVRQKVTPESYLAASLILREAGGLVADEHGNTPAAVDSLTECRSIVAASHADLFSEIGGCIFSE